MASKLTRKKIENNIRNLDHMEGWIIEDIIFEYVEHELRNRWYIYCRNPSLYFGQLCKLSWVNCRKGSTPKFQNIIKPKDYIRLYVDNQNDGWTLVDINYEVNWYVTLLNPNQFNNHQCKVKFASYQRGHKPDFNSIIDKTTYVLSIIAISDFYVTPDFTYSDSKSYFTIYNRYTQRSYSINWNLFNKGTLPGTPAYLLRNIKRRLHGISDKTYSFNSDVLTPVLICRLKEKFNCIPENHDIDHIIPLSWWGNTIDQMRLAHQPENLRLLPSKENLSRGNKLTKKDLYTHKLWRLFCQAENPKGYNLLD